MALNLAAQRMFLRVQLWMDSGVTVQDGDKSRSVLLLKSLLDLTNSQLGQFEDEALVEDILLNHGAYPYTAEINNYLLPHKETLLCMTQLSDEDCKLLDAQISNLPAYSVAKAAKQPMDKRALASRGDLQVIDCCRIYNWLSHHIGLAGNLVTWSDATEAHACMLVVQGMHPDFTVSDAWEFLQDAESPITAAELKKEYGDPDLDAYQFLKYEILYQNAEKSNRATNCQWGLDVGPHQNKWNPYDLAHSDWADNPWDDVEANDQLQVCRIAN